MSEKEIKFDSDVCHYTHVHESVSSSDYQKIEYVKGCKDGKACIQVTDDEEDYEIYKCQEVNEIQLLKPNDKCDYSDECDSGLQCLNKVCTFYNTSTDFYYSYKKGDFYYCPDNLVPVKTSMTDNVVFCYNKSEYPHTSKCYVYDSTKGQDYFYAPGFKEVCGKITTETRNDIIQIKEIESNKIGSQSAGTFVDDMAACESGFAIDYCIDGNYECSSTTTSSITPNTLKKCVDVIEIDSLNGCKIKYNDGAKDMTIRLGRSSRYCMRIQAKLEMFEKYVDKMSKCDDIQPYDNEPLTCHDKDLRKYWYFYENPEEYVLYKDEDDVIDYLVQSAYSSSYYLAFAKLTILLMLFLL
jgi:hypothetical protein